MDSYLEDVHQQPYFYKEIPAAFLSLFFYDNSSDLWLNLSNVITLTSCYLGVFLFHKFILIITT